MHEHDSSASDASDSSLPTGYAHLALSNATPERFPPFAIDPTLLANNQLSHVSGLPSPEGTPNSGMSTGSVASIAAAQSHNDGQTSSSEQSDLIATGSVSRLSTPARTRVSQTQPVHGYADGVMRGNLPWSMLFS